MLELSLPYFVSNSQWVSAHFMVQFGEKVLKEGGEDQLQWRGGW